jgi:hypothetical protein
MFVGENLLLAALQGHCSAGRVSTLPMVYQRIAINGSRVVPLQRISYLELPLPFSFTFPTIDNLTTSFEYFYYL